MVLLNIEGSQVQFYPIKSYLDVQGELVLEDKDNCIKVVDVKNTKEVLDIINNNETINLSSFKAYYQNKNKEEKDDDSPTDAEREIDPEIDIWLER